MSERIKACVSSLKEKGKKGLVPYLMAYDPDYEKSLKIFKQLPRNGADLIELGMPFSDPVAEGKTIQEAAIRALEANAKMDGIFQMVTDFRKEDNQTPIILMGYYNPIQHYGLADFVNKAKEAGVDGFIIVDLPLEEDQEFFELTSKAGLANIKLITPTTTEDRLKMILTKASGFLYYVSITGVTGTKTADLDKVGKAINIVKKHTDIPVAIGFGIKTPSDVKAFSKVADLVVVGSSLVSKIANGEDAPGFVKELSSVL